MSAISHSFILSWPPTLNTYWRSIVTGGRVRVLLSKPGRQYRDAAVNLVRTQHQHDAILYSTDRLDVHLACYPPDRRKRDLDNLPKGILDALQYAGVYQDDEQIDKLTIERMAIRKGGEVIVTIVPREVA